MNRLKKDAKKKRKRKVAQESARLERQAQAWADEAAEASAHGWGDIDTQSTKDGVVVEATCRCGYLLRFTLGYVELAALQYGVSPPGLGFAQQALSWRRWGDISFELVSREHVSTDPDDPAEPLSLTMTRKFLHESLGDAVEHGWYRPLAAGLAHMPTVTTIL